MSESAALIWEATAKFAVYFALLVAVGVAATHWLVQVSLADASAARAAIDRHLARRCTWVAAFLLAATAIRALAHTFAAFSDIRLDGLRTVTLESRWGHAWQIQLGAVVLLCLASLNLRVTRATGWALYSLVALACCFSIPLLGHAAASTPRFLVHAAHITAAGIWIGTLAVLVGMLIDRQDFDPTIWQLVSRFSLFALPSAALLLGTGTIASVLYVQQLSHLTDTAYGRTLLLKLSLVGTVAFFGWRNWRRSKAGSAPSSSVMALELMTAVLAVAATALLTELEHP